MDLKRVSAEQRKAVAGKSPEEILKLAEEEGMELSDDDLEKIAGGKWYMDEEIQCPDCGYWMPVDMPDSGWITVTCPNCGSTNDFEVAS